MNEIEQLQAEALANDACSCSISFMIRESYHKSGGMSRIL